METYLVYITSIVVGALIGWFTNWIAILSLFRPRKKILGFQGVIPKYKQEIAEKVAGNAHLLMPPTFKKIINIPFIGSKLQEIFKNSVTKEVAKMSDEEIEKIVRDVSNRELKFIEILGGVIGAVIGLLQAFIITAFG